MFGKGKTQKELESVFSVLSDDGVHTSFIDEAAVRVAVLPKLLFEDGTPLAKSLRRAKQPILFKNKYICCEAAVLSYIFIDRTLFFSEKYDIDYDKYFVFISTMYQKLQQAISFLYGFSSSEIDCLYDKRCTFFEKLIMDSENELRSLINESVTLFSHVFVQNSFVDFSYNTPLLLLDPVTQLSYAFQVSEYFNRIYSYIDSELLLRLKEAELK